MTNASLNNITLIFFIESFHVVVSPSISYPSPCPHVTCLFSSSLVSVEYFVELVLVVRDERHKTLVMIYLPFSYSEKSPFMP